jgi:hypothetical protein
MSDRQIEVPPTQYVSSVDAGEHGMLFYTSIEEMRDIHFAFVKSGLENNWGVIYAAPGSYSEELRNAMQSYGIDTKKYEENVVFSYKKARRYTRILLSRTSTLLKHNRVMS